jgi:hypothetical protein
MSRRPRVGLSAADLSGKEKFMPARGQLTNIDIPATEARFLRVALTAAAPQWWSVADLRVYR